MVTVFSHPAAVALVEIDDEALERAEEDRLGDVLGLGGVGQQPHRRGKDHVLVFADERLEPISVGHLGLRPPAATTWVTNPAGDEKFQNGGAICRRCVWAAY